MRRVATELGAGTMTQLETGEFPILAKWADGDVRRGFERIGELAADPDRFERGLQTLLDGIELRLSATA